MRLITSLATENNFAPCNPVSQTISNQSVLRQRSLQILLILLVLLMSGVKGWGQTTWDWMDVAPDANWRRGASGARWFGGTCGTGCFDEPGFGILRFNNNHQTGMTNNVPSTYNIHGIIFGSSGTNVRTIGGSNIVRLFDFNSGTINPFIRNESSATHVINFPLEGDGDGGDPLEITINSSGGLTFGGTYNNQGSNINIVGSTGSTTSVTFNGVISGSGGLFKDNSNITGIITTNSSYSGQTTIQNGTFRLSGSGSIPNSNVRLHSGATLNIANSATVLSVAEFGSGNSGVISINSGAVLTIAGGWTGDLFQNNISGAGGLTKQGTGTLGLFGTQNYTGTTTVTGGTLSSGVAMSTGNLTVNGGTFQTSAANILPDATPVTVTSGTYTLGGSDVIGSLAGIGGSVNLNSHTLTAGGDNSSTSYGGVVSGTGALIKNGTGTFTLTGTNTYSGATTINAGTLSVGTLANGGSNSNIGASTNAASNLVLGGGTLQYTGNSVTTDRNFTLTASTTSTINVSTSGQTLTISGAASSTSGALIKTGAGTLTLTGANNYTGLTTVSAGTLQLNRSVDNTIPVGNSVTINGGTLRISRNQTISGLTMSSGTLQVDAGVTLIITGAYSVTGGTINNQGTIVLQGAAAQTFPGTGVTIDNGTAGTMTNLNINNSNGVALDNSFAISGTLTLTAGTLNIGSHNLTLGTNAVSVTSPSATRMIIASGTGEVRRTFTATGSYTFPIGDNTGTVEYSPVTVNVTAGSFSSAFVGVRVINSKHPNNASTTHFLNRYWNVTQSGITGCTATITGTYVVPADVSGTETSASAAQLNGTFNQASNPWVKFSSLGSNTLTATGATLTAGTTSSFTGITGANPTVTISGGNVTVCTNAATALTANPVGDGTFTYSWTGLITGSTTSSTANATTSAAGGPNNYTVTVRDGNGISSAASTAVTVTVVAQPSITAQPSDATICEGGTYSPSITATGGTPSLTYQWQYSANGSSGWANVVNGTPVNATYSNPTSNNSFSVGGSIAAGIYYYRCIVSASGSGCSNATSNNGVLTIRSTTTNIAPTAIQNIPVSTNGTTLTVTEGTNTVTSREWKYSTVDGGPYTTGTGVTASTYTPNFGTANTYYVVCETVYAGPCSVTITSNQVQINVTSNTITTGTITGSPFCIGASVSVPFTYSAAANFPNGTTTFTAQLSDAAGSFASPTTLGTVASNASGSQTITGLTIPSVPAGTGYRIRVVSNSPAVDGADNGTNVTINATNTAGSPSSTPTLCINTALTNITHTTTGATGISNDGVSGANGLPAGVSATWASNTITISGTPTASGTFNYSIPLTGGCGSVNATGTITVTPNNTAGSPSSTPTLCINTALTNITITTTGATGISNSGVSGANGLPAGVSATWASNTITISGTPTASGTFNYSIPLTGGCGSVNATGTITVTPANTAGSPSSTPTLCVNTVLTNITIATTGATGISNSGVSGSNGLPAGVSATWASNTITISGTPTASGVFNYTIPLTGGCGSVNATGTITVTANNTAGAPSSNPTVCINTALTNITIATTGATGIGTATGLPAGVSASWSSNTITISGTPSASGTFNYTIPLTGGCGSVNATGTITVSPNNTVGGASSTPTLCINTALTAITHTTSGATGIGTPSNLPAGVTASWSSNTITISGTPTASGTFTYSIPLTGGCGSVNATGTITVTAANTASAASSTPTLCINTALTTITHTTTGATGIGIPSNLPAGVTASWSSNTITISGTPTASGTFSYTIPLTGGCGSVNATGTITVTANNTVGSGSNPTVCINTALTNITHSTTGATGIGTATGLPAGVSASWSANTITISGTPTASGTFNYSIPLTGGCGTVNATGTITVTALPTISSQPSATAICSGGSGSLSVTASNATSFAWRKRNAGWNTSGTANPWTLTNGDGGFFRATSTNNGGGSSGIDISSNSWGMFNNGSNVTEAVRNFAAMTTGQVFQIDMDNGFVAGTVGFSLRNSSSQNMVEFYFRSGQTEYEINRSGGAVFTGLGFTSNGVRFTLTVTSSTTFSITVQGLNGGSTVGPFTGTFLNSGSISQFRGFSVNNGSSSNNDLFFNRMRVGANSTALLYEDDASNYSGWTNNDNFGHSPLNAASPYSGVTATSLTINPATATEAGDYDVVVYNSCGGVTSTAATVTINTAPAITTQPASPAAVCAGAGTATFTVVATGTALTYQWEESTNSGGSWSPVSNGGVYGGATTATLTLINPTAGMNNNRYRVVVSGTCSPAVTSNGTATLTVNTAPAITGQPGNQTLCGPGTATFTVTATGTGLTYQWQEFISGWNNVTNGVVYSGATTATLTLTNPPAGMNNYRYRVVVSGTCTPPATSDGNATLSVTARGVWLGTTSTDWHTATNWSCDFIPTSTTNVVINSGSNQPTITSTAAARSITINNDATLTHSGGTLTLTPDGSGGGITLNGTGAYSSSGAATVAFAGGGTSTVSGAISFRQVELNGGVNFGTASTIETSLQINGGGFVTSNAAPTYSNGSSLIYSGVTTYGVNHEWVTGTGSGRGVPSNVTLTNNSSITFGTANSYRQCNGNFTIGNGASITLSTAVGGDLYIGGSGNWINENTIVGNGLVSNNRALNFVGSSGDQTMSNASLTTTVGYLLVSKSTGNLILNNNLVLNGTAGGTAQVLQLLGAGKLDLGTYSVTINGDQARSILTNEIGRAITGSAGSQVIFAATGAGDASVDQSSSGNTLIIESPVKVVLNKGINFGSSRTTIEGSLEINAGGFVNTNPPIYGSSSTLIYNSGTTYGRGLEWSATSGVGYPVNVIIQNGTTLSASTGTNIGLSGNLTLGVTGSAGSLTMGGAGDIIVNGNISIGSNTGTSTLTLSPDFGGDLQVRGNWSRTASNSSFVTNGRAVFFNGASGNQTITRTGGETFAFVIIDKSSGNLELQSDMICTGTLTLTAGDVVTSTNKVIISSSGDITAGSNGSHINGNLQRHFATGSSVSRSYPIGDGTNLTTATITLGSVATAGSIVLRTDPTNHPDLDNYGLSPTKYLRRWWTATNEGSGFTFTNGSIEFNYLAGDLQGGASSSLLRPARYTTSNSWAYPTYTTGSNQFTVTGLTNSTLEQSYTAGECQGNISFTPSSNTPVCEGSTLNLFSGTVTGNIGSVTYSWSGPGNPAFSPSNGTQNPTVANVLTSNGGVYTLLVTDAVGCSASQNTTVTISAAPSVSNAGSPQTLCISAGSATLNANNPGSGTGAWSVVSGPSTLLSQFANAAVWNTTFTPAGGAGVYTLRWTISNAPCTASTSDVVITFDALPTSSNAGANQTLCNTSTFTMAGNQPSVGTGVWSKISGPGTITNASLYNTTVTGVTAGSSTVLQWTITNGSCASSSSQVTITHVALPTTAAAGVDQEKCNDGSFTLAGNTPTTGTGAWSVFGTNPGITITTPSSPTSGVTGLPLGSSVTLRWTISNGICTPSTDDVVLTNSYPPDMADAGPDQAKCQDGSFTLAGNNPSNGTGTWSLVSGTATITTPSAYNSTVTGVPAGASATLQWTISSGSCTPTTDDVILTNSNPPTTANAGADQSGCSSGSVTLAGNTPSSGTGTWTIQSGGSGTFSNANSATSTFSAAAGTYILRWTIATAGCTASYDEATITIVNSPTTADAGPNITQCNNSTFTMAGNTPVYGTGTWTVASGSATITTPSSPTTTVTVALGNTATLRWTISNAPCPDSWDEVILDNSSANEWRGNTSSDWNTGSNWSCGVVPTTGSSITIPAGRPNNPTIGSANAAITSLTIDNGATLTMASGYTLTFASGGTFTNNGTFTAGDGTVVFNGTGTIAGSQATTFNHVSINGGVNFGNSLSTINGTLQINGGGFVNNFAPAYGAASTLRYNVNGTYNRSLEWSATSGAGYPNHVVLSNNTTLQLGANSGTATARSIEGNLTIESGSTFSMISGGAMTQPVTVKGNVTIDGTLALSTSAGGDMNVGGNWTVGTSGTQTNNGRLVQFNSSTNATQAITKNGGGTVFFDFLNINNTATNGKVLLSISPATDLQINSSTNNDGVQQLQLNNGNLDLNGRTFTMNGTVPNSTNIRVANGTRTITGPVGSSINFTGSATAGTQNLNVVPATGTDRLLFDDNVNVQTSVGVVFRNTTINSIFQINQNGFVAGNSLTTDPPVYGVNSTLIYNNGTNGFNRNYEWTAASGTLGTTPGYPNNIIVKVNTRTLDLGNPDVSSNNPEIIPLGIAGTLEIEAGAIVTMSAMNKPLTINGTVHLDGTLTLSSDAAGVFNIGGDWIRGNNGLFNQNGRPIRFIGSDNQSISKTGGETFSYITVDKTGNEVYLASNLTVTNTLAIDNGTFDVATHALVINDLITKGTGGNLLSEETGTVIYNKIADAQSVIFAEYGNLTLNNAATKTLANNLAIRGDFTVSGGTVTPGDDIRFSGNREQNIAGLLNYRNMAFSGTGNFTKRFTGNASFTGAMTFTGGAGTVDLDGSGDNLNFTIVSNVNGTARIGIKPSDWTISGSAIAERYIPAQRKWRLISIPVTGETLRQSLTRQIDNVYPDPVCFGSTPQGIGSGTLITGHSMSSCTNAVNAGFDHVVTGGLSSIRFYNSAATNPWASATSTPNVLAPPAHSGYLVFIRGDRNQLETESSITTLRPKGLVKQGDLTVAINQEYVVVGNPYPSPLNFNSLYDFGGTTGNDTRIKRHFWVWDANHNTSYGGVGGYRVIAPDNENAPNPTYTVTLPYSGNPSQESILTLQSGQAIIVERRNSGGSLLISETNKASSSGTIFPYRTTSSPVGKFYVNLHRASGNTPELLMDGVVARFGTLYEKGMDVYDIYKANQFEENISLVRNNKYLSIESRPVPQEGDTLFVPFYFTTNRGYALQFQTKDMAALNLQAILQDKFTGTETPVPLDGSELVYPFTVNSTAASKALDRFRVVFRPGVVTPVVDLFAQKGISIYPNPVVKDEMVQVHFRNSPAGRYELRLTNMLGVTVLQKVVVHSGGTAVQPLRLPAELAAGTYFVEMLDAKGTRGTMKLVVQ